MKITIEAETPEESKAFDKPIVYEGAERLCIAGHAPPSEKNKDGEIGFIFGPWTALKTDVLRVLTIADERATAQLMVNAVLQASNIAANAHREAMLAQEIMAGRNGLKIARP